MNGNDTRERILRAASRLFQLKGYSATGLNEIVAESGAPKGSLYYYFPGGKVQLAIEAVEYAGSIINGEVSARLEGDEDPVVAFQGVVADIIAHFSDRERRFDDVSLSIIALESTSESKPLREACEAVFRAREGLFADKLESSGYAPEEARRLGSLLQILIEGAIVASQTRQDSVPLSRVAAYVPALLKN